MPQPGRLHSIPSTPDGPLPGPEESPALAALLDGVALCDRESEHMLRLSGPGARGLVDFISPRDLTGIAAGQGAYTLILAEDGGILDDARIHWLEDDAVLLILGTGAAAPLLSGLAKQRRIRCTRETSLRRLSLYGPRAAALLAGHLGCDVADLARCQALRGRLFGEEGLLAQTGLGPITGFDILAEAPATAAIRAALLERGGLLPCTPDDLRALRAERGQPAFPQDLGPGATPWEAGLGWAVAPGKPAFQGRAGLLRRRGNERFHLCPIETGPGAAPLVAGAQVYAFGREAGLVTSGRVSPRRGRAIGFAWLYRFAAAEGTPLLIHGGAGVTATVAARSDPHSSPSRVFSVLEGRQTARDKTGLPNRRQTT
ncbi:hypothetical protein M4578_13980 [Salipiger sp. P9]|uniref:glycine cleavage T C-terminal barrel domain-containing protein n=1 Tax=Salipiger pentaromativorans TaxID=2943193 RepID=UPI002157EA38|nr:glycine cleavage T C-terminal barrel domain-containing protein [Salipiger pentaromativorans]MCR8548942.1 hypothetical protein [Salipiger pentaromativorans]